MSEPKIRELEELRAPQRSGAQRRGTRDRILTRAEPLLAQMRGAPVWKVLAGWARPGLAAASIVLALLIGALWRGETRAPETVAGLYRMDDMLLAAHEQGPVPAILVEIDEPDAEATVAAALASSLQTTDGSENR